MITVLLVDDHPLIRIGLARVIERIPEISKCDVAGNGKKALEAMEKIFYDLVILDLNMPEMNGYDTADVIMKKYPKTKILIISMSDERKGILEILKKGVHGYLLKDADQEEITKAIRQVLDGHVFLSELVQRVWSDFLMYKIEKEKSNPVDAEITPREKEIIQLICKQMTAKEIAEALFIAEATVKNHRNHIMKKLGTDNLVGIVIHAIRTGIFVI